MEQTSRPARKVAIADHIWTAFEAMAEQMGSDRDGLINQAMFMFARLNGFLESAPAGANVVAVPAPAPVSVPTPVAVQPATPVRAASPRPPPPVLQPVVNTPVPAARPRFEEKVNRMEDDPQRREVAERVLETAAELERLIKGKNAPPPEPTEDDAPLDEVDEGLGLGIDLPEEAPAPEEEPVPEEDEGGLYLMTESGEADKVMKDRFIIGRGKHCDFVINSGKVSREHAAITHEGGDWFIEDLGSSNGTWFNKQRIKRRKVEDGDEFFICSEKIKLVFR